MTPAKINRAAAVSSSADAAALGALLIIGMSENWVFAIGSFSNGAAIEREFHLWRRLATDCLLSRLIGRRKDGGRSACSGGVIETTSA